MSREPAGAGARRRPADPAIPPGCSSGPATATGCALARLLSFVEGGGERSRAVARLAYRAEPPYVVGLTGAPGAGKSTLVDQLVSAVRGGWPAVEADRTGPGTPAEPVGQVAVLAVDPTSPFSGGAILGDRARMQRHATDDDASTSARWAPAAIWAGSLAVPDAVRVLGAAGMPVVVVETVGVGQVEVEVASATDTTVVVVTPGWGDAMQASKAGLLEVADLFVVNKSDRPGAPEAARDLRQMLDLGEMGSGCPDRRDRRHDRGGDRRACGRRSPPTGLAPREQLASSRSAGAAGSNRSSARSWPRRRRQRVDRLAGRTPTPTRGRAARRQTADPYEVADRLLAT